MLLLQPLSECGSRQEWHVDIENKKVVRILEGHLVASEAIGGPLGVQPFILEDLGQELAEGLVVVNNEHTHRGLRFSLVSWRYRSNAAKKKATARAAEVKTP